MSSKLKVLYVSGPGDVIGTYKHWIKDKYDSSIVAVTYSSQFYDVCENLNAQGYLISSHHRKEYVHDGRFILEHRPVFWRNGPGVLHHIGQLLYSVGLIFSALFYKADVVVVAEGATHFFLLDFLPLFGINVVPLFQCVLWPKSKKPSKLAQLIWNMSRRLFTVNCFASMSISHEINNQIEELTGGHGQFTITYLPTRAVLKYEGA